MLGNFYLTSPGQHSRASAPRIDHQAGAPSPSKSAGFGSGIQLDTWRSGAVSAEVAFVDERQRATMPARPSLGGFLRGHADHVGPGHERAAACARDAPDVPVLRRGRGIHLGRCIHLDRFRPRVHVAVGGCGRALGNTVGDHYDEADARRRIAANEISVENLQQHAACGPMSAAWTTGCVPLRSPSERSINASKRVTPDGLVLEQPIPNTNSTQKRRRRNKLRQSPSISCSPERRTSKQSPSCPDGAAPESAGGRFAKPRVRDR